MNKNFKESEQHNYSVYVKEHNQKISSFLFVYIFLLIFVIFVNNENYLNILLIFIFLILIILIFFNLSKSILFLLQPHLQLIFCGMIFGLYIIFKKIIFYEIIDDKKYFFEIYSMLEMIRLLLFIFKINWVYVLVTNILINIFNLFDNLNIITIEKKLIFFIINLFIINIFLLVSYYQENEFRKLLKNNENIKKNLDSFNYLYDNVFTNQIIIFDKNDKNVLFCNKEALKINEIQNYSKIKNKLINYIDEKNKINIIDIINSLIDNETLNKIIINNDITNNENQKEKFFYHLQITQIFWKNNTAFFLLLNDITNIKKIEKFNEINKYKDNLLAMVTHDLRTPLLGISGILKIVSSKTLDSNIKENIKIAKKSTKLLLFLINDILDYSQINEGKLKLSFTIVKINNLMNHLLSLIKFQCEKKGIQLIYEIEDEELQIYSDPIRIQQILLNLLSNALKFTTKGSIKLSIKKQCIRKMIVFKVQDTGIGIKSEDISKLFNLYGRLEQSDPNCNRSGIGLGLVISKTLLVHLTKNKDSTINVSSEYGKGSKFTFELPIFNDEEEISEENVIKCNINDKINKYSEKFINNSNIFCVNSTMNSSLTSIERKITTKFLVVDDDQINLFIIGKYLEIFDISYKTATNGAMCLDILKKENGFSLVILDCHMPIMNGFETANKIKELQHKKYLNYFPVLALTASSSKEDYEKCLLSQIEYFLLKPVSKKKFKETIEKILGTKIYEKKHNF